MTTTTTWSDYGYWTDFLNGRAHRKVANNTYARLEDDGRIVILYHSTDILTFFPNDEVEYQSGGWLTYTTKERMNSYGAHGVTISQDKGRWFVYGQPRQWDSPMTDYYDGMRVKRTGEMVEMVTEAKHEVDPDRKIKRDIDRYVALYTDERIAELVNELKEQAETGRASGDCWYCQMREVGTGRTMGDIAHSDHLLSHIEEGYTMGHLAYNAVEEAGYRNPPVILMAWPAQVRKCIKKYMRARLATHTARRIPGGWQSQHYGQ